jgi:glycosyltransferase involved in cell wall biosynthesis
MITSPIGPTRPALSVVIAAHDEAAVLGGTLTRLLAGTDVGEFDVVVVANGCTDDTAEVARAFPGVRVIELPEAGKPAALNAGDAATDVFPRIYLDADIELDAAGARALAAALDTPGVLAAAPRRRLATAGRPLLVRAYYAVNGRLPAYRGTLFGRGAIAVSSAGRARFDSFPDVVADDLFVDSRYLPGEKREVTGVSTVVATPWRTRDLLRRLHRLRAGNAALRASGVTARPARRASWLLDVVLPRPWLLPAGAAYAVLSLAAAGLARRSGDRTGWGRDASTREATR